MIGKSFQAQDAEPYGNNLGVDTTFPNEFDSGDGMVGTVGVGYSVNDQIRVEGRLSYREADFNSRELGMGERDGEEFILNGDIKSTALTIEGFYDIPTGTVIKPYVKAGIGASRNSYSARLGGTGVSDFDPVDGVTDGYYDGYADTTSTEFTWNVGIGASYAINEQMSIIGEYQYVSLGEAKTGQDSFTDGFKVDKAAAHEVQLGLQYQF
jgi:opacity protein-like surface antigen